MFWEKRKVMKVDIFMKSGNVIHLDNVTQIKYVDNGVNDRLIEIKQLNNKGATLLMVASIELSQIEAITTTKN